MQTYLFFDLVCCQNYFKNNPVKFSLACANWLVHNAMSNAPSTRIRKKHKEKFSRSWRPMIFTICASSITNFYVLISISRLRLDARNDSAMTTCGRGILCKRKKYLCVFKFIQISVDGAKDDIRQICLKWSFKDVPAIFASSLPNHAICTHEHMIPTIKCANV